jgi:hypothetical protein
MYAARGQYSSASSVTLKPLRQGYESTGAVVEAIRDSSQLFNTQVAKAPLQYPLPSHNDTRLRKSGAAKTA